jgi:hypothetical protein
MGRLAFARIGREGAGAILVPAVFLDMIAGVYIESPD